MLGLVVSLLSHLVDFLFLRIVVVVNDGGGGVCVIPVHAYIGPRRALSVPLYLFYLIP